MMNICKDSQITGIDGLSDAIDGKRDFVMKWDYSPISESVTTSTFGSKDVFKPGYAQAEETKTFMTELTEKQTFITNSRFIPLNTNELDFSTMRTDGKLYSMRHLNGDFKQIEHINERPEATPTFGRKILKCEPYFGRSFVNWLTAKENLMGEKFVSFFQSEAIKEFKKYAEYSVVYGKKLTTPVNEDMMEGIDGLIVQLQNQRTVYDTESSTYPRTAMGYFDAIDFTNTTDDAVTQLKDMTTQYLIQGGDRSRAKFYMSSEAEAELLKLQEVRQDERSSGIYFDKGTCYIWGIPCVHSDTLDFPVNGFNQHVFLGDLNGYVIGTKQDITTESKWDMFTQGWHAVTKLYWGTLLLEPRKILGAELTGLPSQSGSP